MSSYLQLLTEDRRLAILRILTQAPAYAANESVLHSALQSFGHAVSRDTVRTDIEWLGEQALVTVEIVVGIRIATLAMRGLDVAEGRAQAPGVKRPSPRG